jgi:hypothetical protein
MPSHQAILTGYNWNSEPTLTPQRTPMFLTFSFVADWSHEPFNPADKKLARYALKQWGDASGIRFLETKSSDAEIKFSWFTGFYSSTVAYAEFPELYSPSSSEPGDALERMYDAGNVYLNTEYNADFKNKSYKTYALLHEIGHALGLKHPFHKSPYNKKKLSKADDHTKNTVMSYDNGDSEIYPTKLRPLDKLAIKELYGSPKSDGKHVAAWSWDKQTETLTQIGKESADKIHGTGVQDVIHGRGGNDRLYGFDGNDTLNGGTGNDTLHGSWDSDIFVFDTPLDAASNVDKIISYDEDDMIQLSSAVFTKLSVGRLSLRNYSSTGVAEDADDFIVYDEESGWLYYDPDGSGIALKVLFAKITLNTFFGSNHFDETDFYVV